MIPSSLTLSWKRRLGNHISPSSSFHTVVIRVTGVCQQQAKHVQEDPCKSKNKVAPDAAYCDRYWECVDGQPELYDCPNGLVYAGKQRGVTEGCDYPWRADYCDGKTQASECAWLRVEYTIRECLNRKYLLLWGRFRNQCFIPIMAHALFSTTYWCIFAH